VIGLYSRLKSGGKMEHNMYTVTELFGPCAQGEGKYVGSPSIFLRLFGCNLQCQGFGMSKGELSQERDLVANNGITYDTVDALPLVRTGCDSYAAWDTRFKYLSKQYTVQELVDKIKSMLPNGSFQQTINNNIHLVITGGESLLPHWQKIHCEFIYELRRQLNLKYLTFETNGTQVLSEELTDVLNLVNDVTFSVSPTTNLRYVVAIHLK
jgi:organic radical activating enzyme